MLRARTIGQCRRRYGAARGGGTGEERGRGGALGDADVGMPCFRYRQRGQGTSGRRNRGPRRSGQCGGGHDYRRIATVRVLGSYEGAGSATAFRFRAPLRSRDHVRYTSPEVVRQVSNCDARGGYPEILEACLLGGLRAASAASEDWVGPGSGHKRVGKRVGAVEGRCRV
jgi:hypothetical protein